LSGEIDDEQRDFGVPEFKKKHVLQFYFPRKVVSRK
jgi:hypothetical protein